MKKLWLVTILMLAYVSSGIMKGQSLDLYYTSTHEYPNISTGFKLFDAMGNEVRNMLTKNDVRIEEIEKGAKVQREVISLDFPDVTQTTYSLVVSVDVSTSMVEILEGTKNKYDAVKESLRELFATIDGSRTEVAVTAFCSDAMPKDIINYPNDPIRSFTNDNDSLLDVVDNLPDPCPGTNYNAAFLHKKDNQSSTKFSALYWCRQDVAKYKPIIIFLTDGNHNPQTSGSLYGGAFNIEEVQTLANQRNVTIYVIQIGNEPITEENQSYLNQLATIGAPSSDASPNIWMQVMSVNDLNAIFQTILAEVGTLGDPMPCSVNWKSGCDGGSATFTFPNYDVSGVADFTSPANWKPEIMIEPQTIDFTETKLNNSSTKTITLTARNQNIGIDGFEFDNDVASSDRIVISDWGKYTEPPFTLPKDSSVTLTIEYSAIDTQSSSGDILITGTYCNDEKISVTASPIIPEAGLEIISVTSSDYPYVTVGFRLIDAQGNEVRDFQIDDAIVNEISNGASVQREVVDIECPPATETTFSAVLVCDISNSMLEELPGGQKKIDALKDVLKDFVKSFDPKRTEIAITAFCSEAMPKDIDKYPDEPIRSFTNDKDSLLMAIDSLPDICSGTNYNAAFLHSKNNTAITKFSGLHWCQAGIAKYKPVIIFLTDGGHNPPTAGNLYGGQFNIGEVQRLASERNVTIYVIQIGAEQLSPENQLLLEDLATMGKPASDATPNLWLDVNNAQELKDIYSQILLEAGTLGEPAPCYLTYKTDCDGNSATISFPNHGNLTADIDYVIADNKKPYIEINPDSVNFCETNLTESATTNITLTARNSFTEITGIEFITDNFASDRVEVSDWGIGPLPIVISKDSSLIISLEYTAKDENPTDANIKFTGSSCREDILTIKATPVTSVDEIKYRAGKIRIIPNPADDFINIIIPMRPEGRLQVDVLDIMGNIVLKYDFNSLTDNFKISIGSLSSGNYFVRCFSDNINEIIPMVISR